MKSDRAYPATLHLINYWLENCTDESLKKFNWRTCQAWRHLLKQNNEEQDECKDLDIFSWHAKEVKYVQTIWDIPSIVVATHFQPTRGGETLKIDKIVLIQNV